MKRVITIVPSLSLRIEDGKEKKKVYKRDVRHHVISVKEEERPKVLSRSVAAAKRLQVLKKADEKNEIIVRDPFVYVIIKPEEDLQKVLEVAKTLGSVYVHQMIPVQHPQKTKKQSNNTPEVKAAARRRRKEAKCLKRPWKDRCKHCRRYNHHKAA